MALPFEVDSLDDLPEAVHDMYVPHPDGGFELDYGAIKDHPGVKKVRKTADDQDRKRRTLEKDMAELQSNYKDLDPSEAREALKRLQGIEEKDMLDEGKIEELLDKRTERMRLDFEAQLTAKTTALETAESLLGNRDKELSDIKIYDSIKDAALGKGARKEALQDIKNRATGVWSLRDGEAVALDDGEVIVGKRGDPLTIDEWVDSLASEATYLFEPNKGGGATGGESRRETGGAKVVSMNVASDDIAAIANGDAVIDRS
jgi:hypothetical protein